jgi:glucose/arabinose dehydrogenase
MEKNNRHLKRNVLFISVGGLILIVGAIASILFLTKNKTEKPTIQQTPIIKQNTPIISPSLIATGFESPTGIVAIKDASDKRLFVVERSGTIRIVSSSGKVEPTTFLDIRNKVLESGEMGLLGLAFHPDYKQNGYLFVNYIDKNQNTILARYHASSANAVDTSSEKVLFTLKQPYTNHNGGDLVFGPDSYLYVALGDGGSGGDPENRAQNKDSYFGKILRIDINKDDPYAVPPTNPFVGQAGIKPEIWAYGLRNPWRISFDKATGDLYIADVGQGKIEEINIQKANSKGGENYGWRCYEGNQSYKPDGCQNADSYVKPVVEYNHEEDRCSITGGYVYRGKAYPMLDGKYFYGDFCNGQLFYASNQNNKWTQTLGAKTPYSISTFGQGSDGELYFADFKTGSLYRIQDTAN